MATLVVLFRRRRRLPSKEMHWAADELSRLRITGTDKAKFEDDTLLLAVETPQQIGYDHRIRQCIKRYEHVAWSDEFTQKCAAQYRRILDIAADCGIDRNGLLPWQSSNGRAK